MKLARPNVYATDFSLGGVRLDVVADLSATPKSLTVTEKKSRLQMDSDGSVARRAADRECGEKWRARRDLELLAF